MRGGARGAGWALALGCALACGGGESADRGGTDVFVIVLDSAGAAYLTPYAAGKDATPHIAALADEAVVFENAYSQSATTVPSTASLLTGVRVTTHRQTPRSALPLEFPTLAEMLRPHGYRSFGFIANPNAGAPNLGLHRGYDVFMQLYTFATLRENPAFGATKLHVVYPEDLNLHVSQLLSEFRATHTFAYFHFLQPHLPYDPPERFRRDDEPTPWSELREAFLAGNRTHRASPETIALLEARYRANLAYADEGVGALLAALRGAGLYDDSLIVLMADHGEAFFEHGWFGHNRTLYDDMTRIPLIVRPPARDGIAPRRIRALVETIDVLPTLFDYLGLPRPEQLEGKSLWPLVSGRADALADDEVVIATSDLGSHAIRAGHHKLILHRDGREELYDLRRDPGEQRNLAGEQPERAGALRARLLSLVDPSAEPLPPSAVPQVEPELRELLETLGYVE